MHNFHTILEILRAAGRNDSDIRDSILANMMEKLHKKNSAPSTRRSRQR